MLFSRSTFKTTLAQQQKYGIALVIAIGAASFSLYSTPTQTEQKATTTTTPDNSDPRRLDTWKSKWSNGTTRWHKNDVNPYLQKYVENGVLLNSNNKKKRVLVPLCGKTVDMAYLARENNVDQVVGVDCAPIAMAQFAQEQIDLNVVANGDETNKDNNIFKKWTGKSITLLCGDFFQLGSNGDDNEFKFDAVWDRASLVAIQPTLREDYARTIGRVIVRPGGRYLLSTLVRPDGNTTTGPPFSIDEQEVRRIFEPQPWVESVELLEVNSAGKTEPWYKVIGLWFKYGNVKEHIFLIKAK
jgi:thiopurine S-methyltransferase